MSVIADSIAHVIAEPARYAFRAGHRLARHPLRLLGFHSRYADTSFGRYHYWDTDPQGGRPAALFLHGLGAIGLSLLGLAALARAHRRIVLPDVFHFGGLSEAHGERLDTYDQVTALGELADRIGAGPFDVAGHSIGGGGAVWFGARFPEKTRTIALFNPGGFSFGFEEEVGARCLAYANGEFAVRLYGAWLGDKPVFRAQAVRTLCTAVLRRTLRHEGVIDYLRSVSTHDFADAHVRELRCPVLLLWGDHDRFLSSETALYITRELETVEAYWVRGATHMLPIESPYTVNERLVAFWEKQQGAPAPRSRTRARSTRLATKALEPMIVEARTPLAAE
jgi:pimeloyl-ACP methyl ester carboxylesterase